MNSISLLNTRESLNLNSLGNNPYIFHAKELHVGSKRSTIVKIKDLVVSLFREGAYVLSVAPGILLSCFYSRYDSSDKLKVWKVHSQGLYVLVHGLQSHPASWDAQRRCLLKEQPHHDVLIPYVRNRGNCSLDEASSPILDRLLDYIRKQPNKPICLIGNSNGARIVDALELQLRKRSPGTKVMVSTITGVHFGSIRISNGFLMWLSGLSAIIKTEMSYGSHKCRETLEAMQKPLPEGVKRKYVFYGSTEDILAARIGTAFPKVGVDKDVTYILAHGYGHCSLVNGACKDQLNRARKWMRNNLSDKV